MNCKKLLVITSVAQKFRLISHTSGITPRILYSGNNCHNQLLDYR